MPLIETAINAISIINALKSGYDWVTGNTISKRLDKIDSKLEKLDRQIYFHSQQEVWDTSKNKQETIEDLKKIKTVAAPIQKAIGMPLIISKPIVTPPRLNAAFLKNPEEILFDIRPLRGDGVPSRYINDSTMMPVIFERWGQEFIGLIKIGYAKDYLDLEFNPTPDIPYNKAIEINQEDALFWKNKGRSLYSLGRYDEALEAFNKLIQIKPDYHRAWYNKGNALSSLGRNDEALEAYNKAIQIKPDLHEAWNSKGLSLSALDRNEEALEAYNMAISIKPDDHFAWDFKGLSLLILGREQEAQEANDKCEELKRRQK